MLSVPQGEDLLTFLAGLGGAADAWVTGVGEVEDAELTVTLDENAAPHVVSGRAMLVSLSGPLSGPLMATLAHAGSAGLIGGRLGAARSAGVKLVVMEPSAADRAAAAGALAAVARARAAAAAADLADARAAEEEGESDDPPRFGDHVDHFVFGLCEVMVLHGERMKIRAIAGGKLREIHLRAVRVLKPTEQGGRRVFKLVRRT